MAKTTADIASVLKDPARGKVFCYRVTPVTSRWVLRESRASWLTAMVPQTDTRWAHFKSVKPFGYRVVIEDHWLAEECPAGSGPAGF